MKKYFLHFFIFFGLMSCRNDDHKIFSDTGDGGDQVATVKSADEGMNRAIDSAKKTYPAFLKILSANMEDTSKSGLAIKVRFAFGSNGSGEHMWLTQLHFKDNKLYGILGGTPDSLTYVKSGDTLEIKPNQVSDWMYIEKGRLVGGYTIKEFYDRMSTKEQETMEQEMGAKIR